MADAAALPGMEQLNGLVRSVTTPEFSGVTFHEVMSKSALNHVPGASAMPFDWTVNPYRGCSHAAGTASLGARTSTSTSTRGTTSTRRSSSRSTSPRCSAASCARGSWQRDPVMLGTNTDPYQRAEGRYRLMPGIVSALTDAGTPFSILTKGTLLRRDLPLLREAAASVPVSIAMSIAVFDDALQKSVEPGTPTAAARLDTVRAATEAGFEVTVFLMPILPHLTDSIAAIDDALRRIKDAGAVARRLRRAASAARREGLVHAVARARASGARLVVPRAVPGDVGDGTEGVPRVARQAGAPARARCTGSTGTPKRRGSAAPECPAWPDRR